MTQNRNLSALSSAGVSVWLDDLSRDRLTSGNLQQLIDTRSVVGVTTNPSIFQHAISHGQAYSRQLAELAERGADAESAIRAVITDDVRAACDVLRPQWEASRGVDGRVSIEVDPRLANDTEATVGQAVELWKTVDRPNLFIKIPATTAGMPAITATVAEGISVNVTLIFSVERHRQAMDAYLAGLEAAQHAGRDLTGIHSVASLFVSRVDTEIDRRLEAIGTDAAMALRGQAAIANARLAYAAYQDVFEAGTRYAALSYAGAHVQRPLWASTGVKNPGYPDTRYVTELIAPHTVSTIPEHTLEAFADHGVIVADSITGTITDAQAVLDDVSAVGVDLADVFSVLENDGVAKFAASWRQLLDAYPTSAGGRRKCAGQGRAGPVTTHAPTIGELQARRPFPARLGPKGALALQVGDDNRSQDDRHDVHRRVLRVLLHRRADGAVHPYRTGRAGPAIPVQRAVQPAVHHARHGDAAVLRHPNRVRVRQPGAAAADRRPRRCVPRLNALSFWLFLFGALIALGGFRRTRWDRPTSAGPPTPRCRMRSTPRARAGICGSWV